MRNLIIKNVVCIGLALSVGLVPNIAASQAFFTYPNKGQTPAQERLDRSECHDWAVLRSGYDPIRGSGDPQRSAARGTVGGGAVGGLIGSLGSTAGNFGKGLVVGAVTGGLIGGIAGSSRDDKRYQAYLRAGKACMRSRGYTIG